MIDAKRRELIQKIEKERNSRVIVYVMGDRQHMETRIASDQISLFYDHLTDIGQQDQIDLFLYGPGGMTLAGYAIANLIREFCERFCVLIPFRAHSCATLISLGANEIIMSRAGELTPIDPSVTSPYNPLAPNLPPGVVQFLPMSVEDIAGYLSMAKDDFKLDNENSMVKAFEYLTSNIHPIALGSVYRSRQQIGMLAQKLLSFHWDPDQKEKADRTVEILTRELGSHDYIISRREAKERLNLPVVFPSAELETLMWTLFKEYQSALELTIPFNPDAALGEKDEAQVTFKRAFIESANLTHSYETTRWIKRIDIVKDGAPVRTCQQAVLKEAWIEYR